MTSGFERIGDTNLHLAALTSRNKLRALDESLKSLNQALDFDELMKYPGWDANQIRQAKLEAEQIRANLSHLRWITSNYLFAVECECNRRGLKY